MESRVKEVLNKKVSGKYNCAQAVACTYADIAHLDEETVYNTAKVVRECNDCVTDAAEFLEKVLLAE